MIKSKSKSESYTKLTERLKDFFFQYPEATKKIPFRDIGNLFEDLKILQNELFEQYNQGVKKAHEELHESEYRFKDFLDNLADVAYEADSFGNITYTNKMGEKITNLPLDQIIGKPFLPLFSKSSQKIALDVFQRTLHGESPEYELSFMNGKICHFKNEPLRNKDKKIIGVFGVARDITLSKKLKEESRESEETFNKVFHSCPSGLVINDIENGKTINLNESFSRITGYTARNAIGITSTKVGFWVKAEDRDRIAEKLKEKGWFRAIEFEYRNKQGEIRLGRFSSETINIKTKPCIITAIEDITEKKQLEKTLYKAKHELEEKVRQRTGELEEKNIALKVLLSQREDDKQKLEKTILSNMKKLVSPQLAQLKNSKLSSRQHSIINILDSNLHEIISPFANNLSLKHLKLTPTEVQVANFIKHGATSKEIAQSLGLSKRTVDAHRYNIRKKIGIKGKGANLRSHLLSFNST